jgi:beta-glucanase (GH16 family)
MFRGTGNIHSSAVVPVAAIDQVYGKVSARIRVSKVAAGYKSAWLRYGSGCEDDFPEQNWTDTIVAFHHPCNGGSQDAYETGAKWNAWHTVSTEWTPGNVRFYLDGKLVGHSTRSVASSPLSYVMQNESALEGAYAAKNSSAQIDVTWVAVYSLA